VKYRFRAAASFRRALAKRTAPRKRAATAAFKVFKKDPFDPRLRAHKIHKLSAAYGKTVYAVCVESDLRAVF
jgi:hypothetical protein